MACSKCSNFWAWVLVIGVIGLVAAQFKGGLK
jgi:hypothetical protein